MDKSLIENLSPAEAFLLLNPKATQDKRLLKFTLLDLMFRKVLRVEQQQEKKLFGKKKTVLVSRGEKFGATPLKLHEQPFVTPFSQYDHTLEMKNLARLVVSEISSLSSYYPKYIRPSLLNAGYVQPQKKKILFIPYTDYAFTEKGFHAQNYLRNLVDDGRQNLENWLRFDPPRAGAYLTFAGSLVLLLDNLNSELMREWNRQLVNYDLATSDSGDFYYDADFDFDFFSSDSFSDFDSSFDSSFDSGGGGSDWGGDGGDSGGDGGGDGGSD